jgi:hypothetical protein
MYIINRVAMILSVGMKRSGDTYVLVTTVALNVDIKKYLV